MSLFTRGECHRRAGGLVGADSPHGVPIDICAEQRVDPVCQFVMRIKRQRHEFADEAEQNSFLAGMPPKAAKALKHHIDVAKSRTFADFDIRRASCTTWTPIA